jgi:hypothetical protein
MVKNKWSYTSTSLIYLNGVEKDNFTFFILHDVTPQKHLSREREKLK